MQHTKLSTLVTISKVIQAHKKFWSYASQDTILNLLLSFHNVHIRRRMLNYHLADLRGHGMIRTFGRTHRNENGTICLLSSATCLTVKGALFLYKMGNLWALRHMKSLKRKYTPQAQAKHHDLKKKPDLMGKNPTDYPEKNRFLDQECRLKMGLPPTIPKLQEVS